LIKKEKKDLSSIGLSGKHFFANIYLGLSLGVIFALFAVLTNYWKYSGLSFADFGLDGFALLRLMLLSLATAFSEETLFRGYILTRLFQVWKSAWKAGLVSALLFSFIHLPVAFFVWDYPLTLLLLQAVLTFLLGLGNSFLLFKTGTVVAPIVNHTLWGLTVFLFR